MENTNVTNDNNILNTDTEIIKRKDLVATAIQFLDNDEIKRSSYPEKKEFLLSKGLTNAEVDMAMSEVYHDYLQTAKLSDSTNSSPVYAVFRYFLYFSGFSFLFYSLWQRFVDERRRNNELLEKLNTNLEKLGTCVRGLEAGVEKQNLLINSIEGRNKSHQEEMRSAIQSLRSLSLDQLGIPAIPDLKTVSAIPIWQRSNKLTDADMEQCGEEDRYVYHLLVEYFRV